MALSISSVALFAIVCFLSSQRAAGDQQTTVGPRRETVSPTWRADLRSNIGGKPIGVVVGRGRETELAAQTSLQFLDNNTIFATFVIRDSAENPRLSRRGAGAEEILPIRLRAIFLEASSGRVLTTRDWSSDSRYAAIVAVYRGKFVIQIGNELILYSPDLKELTKLSLPSGTEIGWSAHSSLTGQSILFVPAGVGTSVVPWIWVATDSLQIIRSWREVDSGWLSVTDQKIAMVACGWKYDCESRIDVKEIAGDWKTIALLDRRSRARLDFVGDDALFLSGNPARLIQTDGQIVFAEDTHGVGSGRATHSAGGQRFVVAAGAVKGAAAALDLGGHWELKQLVVYDLSLHGRSHTLDVEGPRVKGTAQFALSPDGMRFAILNDSAVELLPLAPCVENPDRPATTSPRPCPAVR
jgi:hypothetical protein